MGATDWPSTFGEEQVEADDNALLLELIAKTEISPDVQVLKALFDKIVARGPSCVDSEGHDTLYAALNLVVHSEKTRLLARHSLSVRSVIVSGEIIRASARAEGPDSGEVTHIVVCDGQVPYSSCSIQLSGVDIAGGRRYLFGGALTPAHMKYLAALAVEVGVPPETILQIAPGLAERLSGEVAYADVRAVFDETTAKVPGLVILSCNPEDAEPFEQPLTRSVFVLPPQRHAMSFVDTGLLLTDVEVRACSGSGGRPEIDIRVDIIDTDQGGRTGRLMYHMSGTGDTLRVATGFWPIVGSEERSEYGSGWFRRRNVRLSPRLEDVQVLQAVNDLIDKWKRVGLLGKPEVLET